jgi:SAM-dependent MidA family methyltransferase
VSTLTEKILEEIAATGVIPFARFMELALYCPELGYYEKEQDTPGRRGDYFTSVSVGKLYGEMLAFQFSAWLDRAKIASVPVQIAEIGAHNGQLATDVLGWLRSHRPELYDRVIYRIVEPSEKRRQWQERTLSGFIDRVGWAARVDHQGFRPIRGIIFANELLDALPVHQLRWNAQDRSWREWGVGHEEGRFVWQELPLPVPPAGTPDTIFHLAKAPTRFAPRISDTLAAVLPDGFTTEVSPSAAALWSDLANSLDWGWLVTADYGLEQEEFFSPDRPRGTLRAYRDHHLLGDVLDCPGEQDITAHVNFTEIRAAGERAGLRTVELTTQEAFLTRAIAPAWRGERDFGAWTPERTRQFQTLTHPGQLGRAFKVLVQTRGVPAV